MMFIVWAYRLMVTSLALMAAGVGVHARAAYVTVPVLLRRRERGRRIQRRRDRLS